MRLVRSVINAFLILTAPLWYGFMLWYYFFDDLTGKDPALMDVLKGKCWLYR